MKQAHPVDVTVILVSYNVRRHVLAALRSVSGTSALRVETIVVDNASSDGTVAAVREEFPGTVVVEAGANRGFGAGNNLGLRRAGGRYVLFLNPDAELRPGALEHLVAYLDAHPDVGIVGPRLRYPDGQVQPSRRRFPPIRTLLIESAIPGHWWFGWPSLRRYYLDDVADDHAQDVDWLVGAALLVRRDAIDALGGFDERFFLYSEELDLGRRFRSRGWRIVFDPDAEVIHHEGKSSEQNLARRAIAFNESKARYAEKYAGADVGRALRLYLLANTVYDLALETSKLLLGHKPELRRARVRALAQVVRFQACHLRADQSLRE